MRALGFVVGLVMLVLATGSAPPTHAQANDVGATLDQLRQMTVSGNLDGVLAMYTPDAVVVSPFGAFTGSAAIRGFYEEFLRSNPGLNVTFIDRTVALSTEVHRSLVSSDSIRMAGVSRVVFIETVVVANGKIVSVTILLDLTDPETVQFASALGG